ncbi:MAG: hypothetical protein AMJ78_10370 [Omnitrophica WOR_2 bacterium SM23_29]|nr:MAG: hypothetical protein AMJ78_10370 [Omnitrophica WOR_2 bacterium SM23_29]
MDFLKYMRKRNIHVLIISGVILFAVLFSLMLTPLRNSIAIKKTEWKKLEAQLIAGRAKLDNFSKLDKSEIDAQLEVLRGKLPSGSPTSAVLDELTKRGKELNIEFISITPKLEKVPSKTKTATALNYKILPIEINMKATYRSLAEYLGILENLESSFATVGEFQIRKDEKIYPKLSIRLVVYTYIIESERGQD